MRRALPWLLAALLALLLAAVGDPREFARAHGAEQRLSIATGGTGGVWYPYGGGVAKVVSAYVPNVEVTAEVTAASVDNLKLLGAGEVDLAFAMADALADADAGRGPFATLGRVRARAIAVLYTNYTHLVTADGSGIARAADLRGKVVSTGSPGSGTEAIALRVIEAAGLDPARDVRRQGLGAAQSVDALRDGKVDAFFFSGGVPTGAVLDLARTPGLTMRAVPLDDVLRTMQARWPGGLYFPATIARGAYPGVERDVPVVGVASVLVADARMSERLAYEITRALFEHHAELAAVHPEARKLTLATAVRGSPVPFHPGALRYYREMRALGGVQ